jgi:hypothetical protein
VPPCQGGEKVQGCTRGAESWRRCARAGWRAKIFHCHHGARMGSIVMPRARRNIILLRPDRGDTTRNSQAGATTGQTVASEQTETSILRRTISLYSQAFSMRLTTGLAETTWVIDAINQRALLTASLPVLILTIPNNPSCTPVRNPITTAVQP